MTFASPGSTYRFKDHSDADPELMTFAKQLAERVTGDRGDVLASEKVYDRVVNRLMRDESVLSPVEWRRAVAFLVRRAAAEFGVERDLQIANGRPMISGNSEKLDHQPEPIVDDAGSADFDDLFLSNLPPKEQRIRDALSRLWPELIRRIRAGEDLGIAILLARELGCSERTAYEHLAHLRRRHRGRSSGDH